MDVPRWSYKPKLAGSNPAPATSELMSAQPSASGWLGSRIPLVRFKEVDRVGMAKVHIRYCNSAARVVGLHPIGRRFESYQYY